MERLLLLLASTCFFSAAQATLPFLLREPLLLCYINHFLLLLLKTFSYYTSLPLSSSSSAVFTTLFWFSCQFSSSAARASLFCFGCSLSRREAALFFFCWSGFIFFSGGFRLFVWLMRLLLLLIIFFFCHKDWCCKELSEAMLAMWNVERDWLYWLREGCFIPLLRHQGHQCFNSERWVMKLSSALR